MLIQQEHTSRKPLPSRSLLESQLDAGYWGPGKYMSQPTLKKKKQKPASYVLITGFSALPAELREHSGFKLKEDSFTLDIRIFF